ncbi:hypothetical protein ACTMTF_34700 [Nonomuraea sp. ZG12]|uniref:hypothetical protein n=1 Tax=Nonomuraea sp. ZG12 TaxID=3452207 RepID=UPI003F89EB08
MTEPHTVYVITDAPHRTDTPGPVHARPVRRAGVLARAVVAVAALLLVSGLIPDVYGCRWWLYGAVLGWLVWPSLARIRAFAALLFGALDALLAAMLGTRRLVYLAALLRQAVRDTRTSPRPGDDAGRDDDAASSGEGDPS